MKRMIALLAMFFLLTASTGVHKTFAASTSGHSVAHAVSELAKSHATAKAKCCKKSKSHGSALHGSCSIPCITLATAELTILVPKGEKPSPMKGALFEGNPAELLKRPPKHIF